MIRAVVALLMNKFSRPTVFSCPQGSEQETQELDGKSLEQSLYQ